MTSHLRLGIDVACKAAHRASLTDATGEFIWSGRSFRTDLAELDGLWDAVVAHAEPDTTVEVVLEPTRNAWAPLAAWLSARGADVVLVPPEQSADLRDYYNKHTKTDRLDSRVLARLPLLHPEGLLPVDHDGPADPLKRAVRLRSSLVKRRTASMQRIDGLLELYGPGMVDALGGGGEYTKTVLGLLADGYADPAKLRRYGKARLTHRMAKASRGAWGQEHAEALLAAAADAEALWDAAGGIDFAAIAADIACEARQAQQLTGEIAAVEARLEKLYAAADPAGIIRSAPMVATVTAATFLGLLGDPNRFANLAGVRAFTGLVPRVDQSGQVDKHGPPTKKGDPQLRETLFLAADRARKVDPTLAAKYHQLVVDKGKHHNSAICTLAATLATRLAACWRNGQRYVIHDTDGREITDAEGREICADQWTIPPEVRQRRRATTTAKRYKQRTGPREEKSTVVAPTLNPSTTKPTQKDLVGA
ncbi:MAG TPA: IS110 family transposase [Euzebya sp.]|nr:IS110 family transposase [Euzebya sp.]